MPTVSQKSCRVAYLSQRVEQHPNQETHMTNLILHVMKEQTKGLWRLSLSSLVLKYWWSQIRNSECKSYSKSFLEYPDWTQSCKLQLTCRINSLLQWTTINTNGASFLGKWNQQLEWNGNKTEKAAEITISKLSAKKKNRYKWTKGVISIFISWYNLYLLSLPPKGGI